MTDTEVPLLAWLLVACAVHTHTGLVQVEGERVVLVGPQGEELRVASDDAGAPLRFLEGTRVAVKGRRLGRRLHPKTFQVLDAGDGSAPFVGRLRRYGSNWLLDDRTTGSTLMLDEASVGGLAEHDGRLVMVIGYVVGPQRVNVVLYKVLEPTP